VEEFSAGRSQENGLLKGPIAGGLYFFTAADGMLWIVNNKKTSNGTYVFSRFDPKTHERVAKIEADDSNGVPVIWDDSVWLPGLGYLIKVNSQTNHVSARLLLPAVNGGRPLKSSTMPGLLTDGKTLWAVNSGTWAYSPVTISRIQKKAATDPDNR
jgi:hypothetical protein